MTPLILSTVLSFISVHSSFFGKQILKWINKPSLRETNLLSQKFDLKQDQSQISMVDNFAKYSKIQRKINRIDEELAKFKSEKNNLTLQIGLNYGLKVILGIILLIMSYNYRYAPVFKMDSNLDFMPFNYVISYPNEYNCVSLHFWILCSSAVARLIKI